MADGGFSPKVVAGIAGAGVLATGAALLAAFHPAFQGPLETWTDPPDTRTYTFPTTALERYAARSPRLVVPERIRREWVRIPIVVRDQTRFAAASTSGFGPRESALARLQRIKMMVALAGLDIDPRAIWRLWGNECGWGGAACYGYNPWNLKANWSTYGSREDLLERRQVYVSPAFVQNYEVTGVWCVEDRIRSNDIYFAHSSFRGGIRIGFEWLLRLSRYAGAREGYQRGGLEGLVQAEQALARGGYSPAPASRRETEARAFWSVAERMLGSDWTR